MKSRIMIALRTDATTGLQVLHVVRKKLDTIGWTAWTLPMVVQIAGGGATSVPPSPTEISIGVMSGLIDPLGIQARNYLQASLLCSMFVKGLVNLGTEGLAGL